MADRRGGVRPVEDGSEESGDVRETGATARPADVDLSLFGFGSADLAGGGSADEAEVGWGDVRADDAGDRDWYLREKPPHYVD